MFDAETSFLLRSISVDFRYIHRHIFQGLRLISWAGSFTYALACVLIKFSVGPTWIREKFVFTDTLAWVSSLNSLWGPQLEAQAPLCRRIDRSLHPAPCWAHRCHGTGLQSLDKHSCDSFTIPYSVLVWRKQWRALRSVFLSWVGSFTETSKTVPEAESEAESVLFCSDWFQSLRMNIVHVILILGIC